jgi:hypothetical protein
MKPRSCKNMYRIFSIFQLPPCQTGSIPPFNSSFILSIKLIWLHSMKGPRRLEAQKGGFRPGG